MSNKEMFNPPRPTLTPDMIKAAADKLVSQPCFPLDDIGASKDEAIKELVDCYRHHMNGYELAKALDDDHGWNISSMVVDDLECMGYFASDMLTEAERAWVAECNIQPPLPVGAELDIGVITDIADHHSPGCYLVKEYGQESDSETGCRRLIVKFEDAK